MSPADRWTLTVGGVRYLDAREAGTLEDLPDPPDGPACDACGEAPPVDPADPVPLCAPCQRAAEGSAA